MEIKINPTEIIFCNYCKYYRIPDKPLYEHLIGAGLCSNTLRSGSAVKPFFSHCGAFTPGIRNHYNIEDPTYMYYWKQSLEIKNPLRRQIREIKNSADPIATLLELKTRYFPDDYPEDKY